MKFNIIVFLIVIILFVKTNAADLEKDISNELGLEEAQELVPQELENDGINFSPSNTPQENGMSINSLFKTVINSVFDSLTNEIIFVFTLSAVLILATVIRSFVEQSNTALFMAVKLSISTVVASLIINHIENAFYTTSIFVNEITTFMTGLMPFLTSLSLVGGGFSTSVVQKTVLLTVINILQNFIGSIALPICKVVISLAISGYVTGISLGALSEFISGVSTKIITLSCGVMAAVLYFQSTVSSVTDSLALRSVKLAAGSFIPIVGSFVSEASGTLISGVKLVKSTFGVFAICVLIYMSLKPIVNFFIIKLAFRFSGVIAKMLNCDSESRVLSEISSVYNILSAIMITSVCFFLFSIAIFIKTEVG